MRGRKPRAIEIAPDDLSVLQQIAHSQTWPWFQVQVPASFWESPMEDGLKLWPSRRSATNRPCVAPAAATNAWVYPASWSRHRGRDARSRFPPCNVLRSSSWPAWNP